MQTSPVGHLATGLAVSFAMKPFTMTPLVVLWFRLRHSKGGRHACRCWICAA